MQILGIIGTDGKAIPNTTITMFCNEADKIELETRVATKHVQHEASPRPGPFNTTKARWDMEFEMYKERIQIRSSSNPAGQNIRLFPLEEREYANNQSNYSRLQAHKIV